jgi:hypothetical protein
MFVFLAIIISSGGGGASWAHVWMPVQAVAMVLFFCFPGKSFSPGSFTRD